MKHIRVLIYDDDEIYVDRIRKCINTRTGYSTNSRWNVDTCTPNIQEEQQILEINNYSVFFINIDIDMQNINVDNIITNIKSENRNILLILISNTLKYAICGYKWGAFRYLLKSDSDEDIEECVDDILKVLGISFDKIELNFGKGTKEVYIDDIYFVESIKHNVVFHVVEEGKYYLYDKLDAVGEILCHKGFLRIHKSYLVNIKYINKIANYKVELINGEELPVPRERYRDVIKEYIEMKQKT